ncbi:MAG: ABC transporter ATP-binding protein [Planctomycetota bacterium]
MPDAAGTTEPGSAQREATGPSTPQLSGERPVVACQKLTKTFKDFWLRDRARAVDNLDMLVRPHEIFGLLGPNGSGKSTTIKIILGLLRPTSGRVAVFGKPPTDVATKKRIGYLPEESYLYPFLNARETLDYYAKLFELDRRTRTTRVDELLEMVGLTHVQHRAVREYSKGMQRRIGLAQALINDPDLLILDEPTTGLDPIGTRQVKDLIIELGRRGKTVILSSHLLADVEDVVDRMVILYGGKSRGEGTCDELLNRNERTTIELDELDDDTVAEIDRIVRERSGGAKSILSVEHPRQKLEELFLGIVEKARSERLGTSGAQHGAGTAAFLKDGADEPREGEELIGDLLAAGTAPLPAVVPDGAKAGAPAQPQAQGDRPHDLIDDLLNAPADTQAVAPPSSAAKPAPGHDRGGTGAPVPPPPGDVDDDVIGSLLDGTDDGSDEGTGSGAGDRGKKP